MYNEEFIIAVFYGVDEILKSARRARRHPLGIQETNQILFPIARVPCFFRAFG